MPIGLKGNTDGSGAVQIGGSDAISISTGLNTTFAGTVTATGTVAGSTGTLYPLTSGTAVASTSGTAIDFTGIPSWAKRITVMFNGVSTNGGSNYIIQIGSGSFTTSGYASGSIESGSTRAAYTTGFGILSSNAGNALYGHMVLTNVSANAWVSSLNSVILQAGVYYAITGAGGISLSGTLDRVRITTVNGTDTFDAGSINILYE
jgi:hypothetical protein